jgi:hypothetical protein
LPRRPRRFRTARLVRSHGQTRPERGRFRNASRNRARAPASCVKLLPRQASEALERRRLVRATPLDRASRTRPIDGDVRVNEHRRRVCRLRLGPHRKNLAARPLKRFQPTSATQLSKTERPEQASRRAQDTLGAHTSKRHLLRRTMPASTRSRPSRGRPIPGCDTKSAENGAGPAEPALARARGSIHPSRAPFVGRTTSHRRRGCRQLLHTTLMPDAHTSRARAVPAKHPAPHRLREPELSRGRPRRYPQPDPFRTPLFFAAATGPHLT